ncbi:possible lysine-specific histone demethylase 1-like [Galleria mellonella]|uniref:Possible lysine-specific histone demethylase 1-like n=1 Tax=Galleria mellonella TaxID=7137 RepID=A0ABM3MBA7_GALME|nr:possible lysine-specific histone demethylase 1-like [Galleria mellonella]
MSQLQSTEMSYRALLAVALCGAAWAASVPHASNSQSYDTIVIGLGSAGATAASTLARAGRRVLALEAQDRVGGRVHTVPFGDGVVELGAEWIHGTSPNRVYDAAVQNNVTLLPQDFELAFYRSDGREPNTALINELFNYLTQYFHAVAPTPQPMGQYVTQRLHEYLREKHPSVLSDQDFIDEFLRFVNLFISGYEATTSWNDLTSNCRFRNVEGHPYVSWNRHGYRTFFEILLNKYNNGPGLPTLDIKLSTEVTRVAWSRAADGNVTVTTADGATYTADNVIVTVSIGVLQATHETLFSPELDQDRRAIINNISMGLLHKIILRFPHVWWPERQHFIFIWSKEDASNLAEDEQWLDDVEGITSPMGTSNAITLWLSGDTARLVESLPDDVVQQKSLQLLRRFLGRNTTVPEPTGIVRSSWHSNPFTRGSYTYDNVLAPQYPTAREDLGAPLTDSSGRPRVLFAGEATNPTHFSTVHGASETGYREATRLLQAH